MPEGKPSACRSNSPQPLAALAERFEVVEVGLDTVSLAWRPTDPSIWQHFDMAAKAETLTAGDPLAMPVIDFDGTAEPRIKLVQVHGKKGIGIRTWRTDGHIAGVPWTFYPSKPLIYCEGRLTCILHDDSKASGLPAPATLERAAFRATFLLAQLGIELDPDEAVVRRCDITGRVRFPRPELGQALQRALRDHAGDSPEFIGQNAVTESVLWKDSRDRITFISYDEGVSRGTHVPGEMIRLEARHRPDKPKQLNVREFLQRDLGALWLDAFDRRTAAAPPLGSRDDAQAVIERHIENGELSVETGTRLQGSIDRLERGGYALWGADKLSQDHRRRLTRKLEHWGVETITPDRRRGDPWPTAAFCRPADAVLQIAEVSRSLRTAMADARVAERFGSA